MTANPDPGQARRVLLADGAVYLSIAVVSVLHYVSPMQMHALHDVYRRLYYLPIIFASFLHGVSGGLVAATLVTLAYIPHAFGSHSFGLVSHDPATTTQKVLEIVLYYAVGVTTGGLVSRLRGTQVKLEKTAQDLLESLQQLRTAEEQLLQSARLAAVGRLSAGLAHEIRNPLAAIKGSAEILSDDFPDGHPKRRLLQVLVEESVRLNNVLARFLAFARPRPLEEQEFDLVKECEAVVSFLDGQTTPRTVRHSLDAPSSAVRIRGDRERLRQVLLNVLLNAWEAAGEGGEIAIRCETADGMCRIEVRDSGVGFTKEAIENAFTPFFTTKDQGSGLGLALSHRIIEQHGGQIRIGNHEGGGGQVEILIPLGRRDG